MKCLFCSTVLVPAEPAEGKDIGRCPNEACSMTLRLKETRHTHSELRCLHCGDVPQTVPQLQCFHIVALEPGGASATATA